MIGVANKESIAMVWKFIFVNGYAHVVPRVLLCSGLKLFLVCIPSDNVCFGAKYDQIFGVDLIVPVTPLHNWDVLDGAIPAMVEDVTCIDKAKAPKDVREACSK